MVLTWASCEECCGGLTRFRSVVGVSARIYQFVNLSSASGGMSVNEWIMGLSCIDVVHRSITYIDEATEFSVLLCCYRLPLAN